jgi:hypothetical protein
MRQYQGSYYRRYQAISPVGVFARSCAGNSSQSPAKCSIRVMGSPHACVRRLPRPPLCRLPGRLDLGDEISAAGLTVAPRSATTSVVSNRGEGSLGGSRGTLLRRASVVLAVGASGLLTATALAAGPAPDPAPPRTATTPTPEPVTGKQPAPAPRRTTQTPTVSARPQAIQPAPAPPVSPPPPPPIQPVIPLPAPAPARVSPAPARVQRRATVERKATRKAKTKAATRTKRTLPALGRPKAADSSSPDTMLLIGGLALVVLVLGDTLFLAASARLLRLS